MLQEISEKVSSGGNLSDGLAIYPKTFDNLFVNMVKAGEAGGVFGPSSRSLGPISENPFEQLRKSNPL